MTSVFSAIQKLCLAMPETTEAVSHGSPVFKVQGKTFATYSVNHHGDGKIALIVNASLETQDMLTSSAPDIFYRPPYVGHKGWVGISLNKGLKWSRVCEITHQAYQRTAPDALARTAEVPSPAAPTEEITTEDIDPLKSEANQALMARITDICDSLPEVTLDQQFGQPAFKAGKKTFCLLAHGSNGPYLQIWVGRDAQPNFTDPRFSIPPYTGTHGWINLNLKDHQNWDEIRALILESYRHFALKRMLKALEE